MSHSVPSQTVPSHPSTSGETRLKRLLIRIGDELENIPSQIKGLALVLEDDYHRHANLIIDTLMEAVVSFSFKTGIYASLMAYGARQQVPDLIKRITHRLSFDLEMAIRRGSLGPAQRLLRLAFSLMSANVLTQDSTFAFISKLLDAADTDSAVLHVTPAASDFLYFLVLSSIPWISKIFFDKENTPILLLIQRGQEYCQRRKVIWKPLIQTIRTHAYSPSIQQNSDRLEYLVEALKSMCQDEWRCKSIFRFYQSDQLKMEWEEIMEQYGLPDIEIHLEELCKNAKPLGDSLLWLSSVSSDANILFHDRWFLQNHFEAVIEVFQDSMTLCNTQLFNFPINTDDYLLILIETIFDMMLRLPSEILPEDNMRYPVFFVQLLKKIAENSDFNHQIVEKVIVSLFKHLDHLDIECYHKIVYFCSLWMDKFGFVLQLDKWMKSDELANVNIEKVVADILAFSGRLSSRQTVRDKTPLALHGILSNNKHFTLIWPDNKEPAEFSHLVDIFQFSPESASFETSQEHLVSSVCKLVGSERLPFLDSSQTKSSKLANGLQNVERSDLDNSLNQEAEDTSSSSQLNTGLENDDPVHPIQKATTSSWSEAEAFEILSLAVLTKGNKSVSHMRKLLSNYSQCFSKILVCWEIVTFCEGLKGFEHLFCKILDFSRWRVIQSRLVQNVFSCWKNSPTRLIETIRLMISFGLFNPSLAIAFVATQMDINALLTFELIKAIFDELFIQKKFLRDQYLVLKRQGQDTLVVRTGLTALDAILKECANQFISSLTDRYQESSDEKDKIKIIPLIVSICRQYGEIFDEEILTQMGKSPLSDVIMLSSALRGYCNAYQIMNSSI